MLNSKLMNVKANIIVAAGLNNIPSQCTADEIILKLKSLISIIKSTGNRISMCTLPYPPKFCSHQRHALVNREKIRKVNEFVEKFNASEGLPFVDLSKFGVTDPHAKILEFKESEVNEISIYFLAANAAL